MKIKANLLNKPVNFQMDDCQIEKVVELPRDQFSALVITAHKSAVHRGEQKMDVRGQQRRPLPAGAGSGQ